MHFIEFVPEDALPEGHDFLFVELPGGAVIFYRESALTPQNLMDSWTAYRALQARPPQQPTTLPPDCPPMMRRFLELVA